MNLVKTIQKELKNFANPEKKKIYQRFFKTAKGQYGEGDIFLGVTTPQMRSVAKKYFKEISLEEIQELMMSEIHEHRSVAFVMLVEKYQRLAKTKVEKKELFAFYLKNAKRANNWDLVDISCHKVIGAYILEFPKASKVLYELVKSDNLWEQRISIVSTVTLIRAGELEDTLEISKILLSHQHDLIHKAVGWMLRELGKKDQELLEQFLRDNYNQLPRTTLRYAIERFDEGKRKAFLVGQF